MEARSLLELVRAAARPPDRVTRAASVDDLRALARRRLPRMVFDFVDGAAEEEWTAAANRTAFRELPLAPRALTGVSAPVTATELLGTPVSLPVVLGPAGLAGLVHADAEPAVAAAAARAGTAFTAAALSSAPLRDIAAAAGGGPLWFQLYATRDRRGCEGLIQQAVEAGCSALVVTVDTPAAGLRERDLRNGFTIPPSATPAAAWDAASHPLRWMRWVQTMLRGPGAAFGSLAHLPPPDGGWLGDVFNARLSWEDLRWIRAQWPGPLAAKGILRPDDARRAVECGCDGVIVSNHGGRQLDGARASLQALVDVATALHDERAQVLVDGGVRRGADVVRALALGADGCLVVRPWMWALGAAGERGVQRLLEIFHADLVRTLVLAGIPSVDAVGPDAIGR
jgi:isopentenyl diphosphate isomerase/L-lactate dehydrogenase-like FMN-dependent dehydrogenase